MVDLTIHTYTAAESGLFVNSYLLETPAGVLVVDTNLLVSDIAALKSRLAALHKPLLGVFITHAHPDHFNGALELVRGREVPVHATSGVAKAIRGIADAKRAQWGPVYGAEWPTETYYPNTELGDGQPVTIDGLAVTGRELGQGESHADSILLVQPPARPGRRWRSLATWPSTAPIPTPPTGTPAPGSQRSTGSPRNWSGPGSAGCCPAMALLPVPGCWLSSAATCCSTGTSCGAWPTAPPSLATRPRASWRR
jgi:Metallo-beta-lactamase superfamily